MKDLQTPIRARKYGKTSIQYLNEDELSALLAAIDSPRDKALFYVASRLGLRATEVGMIQLADFRPEAKKLFIRRLKRGHSGEYRIPDNGLPILRRWIRERGTAAGPLFPSRNHRPISRKRLHELMQHYAVSAHLPIEKQHFHCLRHTTGTLAMDHGDLSDVMDLLGHRDPRSTAVYAKVRNKRRTAFEERLNSSW